MHVLMTTDTVGGVWTYAYDLVAGLLQHKIDVSLVCLGRKLNDIQWEEIYKLSKNSGAKLECISTDYKLEWMQDCQEDLNESAAFLARVIADRSPDLVHLNQYCYGSLPINVPKVVVAHSDVVSWWQAVHNCDPEESRWVQGYRHNVLAGLKGADAVVAPSKWYADQIQSIYQLESPVIVIANGRNTEGFDGNKKKQLRAVSIGRLWDAGKQIRILEEVRTELPIWVAGDITPPKGQQNSAPEELKGVKYLGALSGKEVRKLLESSAVYVVTSRYEPFGLAPVEAAFCGCAVVANDLPSLREIWGDAALYFQQNDAASLSEVLNNLLADQKTISLAGCKARDHAYAHLNDRAMIDRYVQLYQDLIRERSD